MASQSETGHFKNLANIKLFKDFLIQLGTIYNPSNTLLKIPAITTLITQCQTDYDGWVNKLPIKTKLIYEKLLLNLLLN